MNEILIERIQKRIQEMLDEADFCADNSMYTSREIRNLRDALFSEDPADADDGCCDAYDTACPGDCSVCKDKTVCSDESINQTITIKSYPELLAVLHLAVSDTMSAKNAKWALEIDCGFNNGKMLTCFGGTLAYFGDAPEFVKAFKKFSKKYIKDDRIVELQNAETKRFIAHCKKAVTEKKDKLSDADLRMFNFFLSTFSNTGGGTGLGKLIDGENMLTVTLEKL